MSATTTLDKPTATSTSLVRQERSKLSWAVADGLAVTWRNLIAITRIPDAMFFSSIQPVMFILLFRYVFGGAIQTPGFRYVDYLMPGIFVQTIAFGAIGTAVGLADDMGKGLIERFRSLPMARSAVLVGRTTADLVRNVWVIILMTGVGLLVGFRIHNGLLGFLAGVGILLLFSYAVAWGFATIGLMASSGETAQLMVFPVLMPLTFASGAFVPVATMPGWLQTFARNQPVTAVVDATRALMNGGVPTAEPVFRALAWSIGLLAVLAPLAVARYRKAV
ncbi:MAG TPA: ABC transporter permease [Acidimicrobiales bacterium]|nr:ABC transporter permease [Acidimicrobiales bacterium]